MTNEGARRRGDPAGWRWGWGAGCFAVALGAAACMEGNIVGVTGAGGGGAGATEGGVGAAGSGGGGAGGSSGGAAVAERVDLLLMIDNSVSMADKQELLAEAVPALVGRLVNPRCVDPSGAPVAAQPAAPDAACPGGSAREFPPIADVHVGVVSSSLGGHGGEFCPATTRLDEDDKGQLIASVRPGLPSHEGQGFLFWGPGRGGEGDLQPFVTELALHVTGAGETGCGFEAQLESWYRFLIDPAPPLRVVKTSQSITDVERDAAGQPLLNQTLLAQRAAFLRPDSLVAIVMLSDENDCSLVDYGFSWLVGSSSTMPRGTAACATDPNSPCCRSCALAEGAPPYGCAPIWQDAECSRGSYESSQDQANLRCFQQRQRFGLDFLHPVGRYVTALRARELCPQSPYGDSDCGCQGERRRRELLGLPFDQAADCDSEVGAPVPNPLFTDLATGAPAPRGSGLVLLAGIVGVPWQDLATEESLAGPGLTYLSPSELSSAGRWEVILGEPVTGVAPTDPFMVEAVAERLSGGAGVPHPFLREAGGAPVTTTPPGVTNSVNGNEYDVSSNDDLQYACVFDLPQPRDCATATGGCDCKPGKPSTPTKPVCQGGSTLQTRAKAYPSLRLLNVLRDLEDQAVVASICPKHPITVPTDPGTGYQPAIDALARALIGRIGVE